MAGAQLGITVCSLGLGAVGEPAVAHLLEPLFHAARVPDDAAAPGLVRGRAVDRGLPARGARRDGAQEHRPRRPRPRRARARPAADGDRHRAAPGDRRRSTRSPTASLRLLGVEPKDEVHSTFTREEVAALVEESRGEGLLEDERVRPARRRPRASPRRPSRRVLMPLDTLATVAAGRHRRRRRGRSARRPASRRFPVVGRRRRRCSATSTSRTCSSPTTDAPRARRSRTSGSARSPRVRAGRPAARRAREPAASRAPTWPGSSATTARSLGAGHPRGRPRGARRRDPRRGPPRRVRAVDATRWVRRLGVDAGPR